MRPDRRGAGPAAPTDDERGALEHELGGVHEAQADRRLDALPELPALNRTAAVVSALTTAAAAVATAVDR